VIAVIVTGLLWFTGRASTAILVTVIIGIAIVFSADSIVGIIAG
jgi:type IV secretion system protein VirB2